MLKLVSAKIGEDVIVIKESSSIYDRVCQIWKLKKRSDGTVRVSVSDDGEIYNFGLEDLVLA
ncbi:hypothetical protein [Desulfoluna spongiiphila]|uniref:hypothetical protein n=1 Tax=Desulfoluna spongiiphila TaxID=419481 RepID=UPI00125FCFDF|nr:hypothetical protein [Desulfoluna spongiiphila]